MPALPPDLYEEIVNLCTPLVRREGDRDAQLLPTLSDWSGFDRIVWEGSARTFTTRLVYQLPGARLQQTLRALLVGSQDERRITELCRRVEAALTLTGAPAAEPLQEYHQERVAVLSAPRYRLDSRFVGLTLLLDKGVEAQGVRFVQDAAHQKYQSLDALLNDLGEGEPPERAAVLLGRPGSGKTTLLRRLQLEQAWAELDAPTGRVAFFVSLNGYRGTAPGAPPPDPYTWLAGQWETRYPSLPDFETLFRAGRFLLLLDGLNEMPHRDKVDYRERIGRWRDFWGQYHQSGNTMVFSCRSLDYSAPLSSESAPVRQVQVEPLSEEQIREFLALYLDDAAAPVWDALREERQLLALFATPFFLRLLVDQVAASGEMPAGQAALLTGFVRRALYREIVERKHRLFTPDRLLSEDDVGQVLQHAWATAYDLPEDGVLLPGLAQLAYRMQEGYQADEGGQVRVPERAARTMLEQAEAAEVIAAGIQLNVLDKELATREVTFFHQLTQEYFAARILARSPEPERLAVPWRSDVVAPSLAETIESLEASDPLPPLPATGWEETALLAAAMAGDQERFVADLQPVNLPLAARCAAAPEVTVSPTLVEELGQALLARIGDPAADLRARIAAAEALGELGDPRFARRSGPHGDYLLPPTVRIPGGMYPIGDDDSQYDDEKPAHQVEIESFEIGVFPVTNAEYQLFMEAGGYEDERWWETEAAQAWLRGEGDTESSKAYYRDLVEQLDNMTDDAIQQAPNVTPDQIELLLWLKRATPSQLEAQLEEWFPTGQVFNQPEFWDDSRFNHPAQPVVGVTWFEARAYCAWLSVQVGEDYHLPSEAEWEAAAAGRSGRRYAYGEAYDSGRCNTFETHIRRTTPVGVFPGGQTPEGVADLSGNIWEWTSSQYRPYPYDPADGREDPADADARRVLRGGSWPSAQDLARSAYRYYFSPDARYSSDGFRVVVVRRPPSHQPAS